MEVGAWLLPDTPRRHNGAAQMACDALPKGGNSVALGLIGLDEEEEDQGFQERMISAMVPLGSPIKNVMKILYDLDLKDGAPCANLTHILVFENAQEKQMFREHLLDLVPDFMIGFGAITDDAMMHAFNNAKEGSPIILFKHTGKNVDSLCRMFRHAITHMKVSEKESHVSPPETQMTPAAKVKHEQGAVVIPPIAGEENELIKLFINTWPPKFNAGTIVLSDPLIMPTSSLQKKLLGAISAAFDLKTGSVDIRLAKRKALTYAWSFCNATRAHLKKKKRQTESIHIQLVLFTVASIAASVFYDRVYGKSSSKTMSKIQLVIYLSTILLPIYITSVKQESDKGAQLAAWGVFSVASARVESEIYKFRTQVGRYRAKEKTEIAMQNTIEAFVLRLEEIWRSVKDHMQEDGMILPEDFWAFDPDDVSSISEPSKSPKSAIRSESPVSESTQLLPKSDPPNQDENDEEDPPEEPFVDDLFSPLKTDDYLEDRMERFMTEKSNHVKAMVRKNQILSFIIKIITILSGAAAALHLQWCVPVVLAVTAAFGTGQEFRKYPSRIDMGNSLVLQLNELKLWWMGMSMYEKQLPKNKNKLILTAEQAMLSEIESTFGSPRDASNKDLE
eukprot:CAMPEP_0171305586 /NCGR_PEP_ID=MMETSP0816-20121228/15467_1 /TAXON_ID=420281 /ORGANISM="Proboscia inermis, Strain CCAP1064/1" /LENGTH=618 /DNA_ID=CAMNT_0011786547 /DNA_START=39 /DNA_END=1895 /DNA_ORIENTATION=+